MDLRDAIRSTAAIREFTPEPVSQATVAAILDDARFAPSGGNRQPWRVVVLDDRPLRRALATLMQPAWDEYRAAVASGQVPFNAIDYAAPSGVTTSPSDLLDSIEQIPVVLVVAADLRRIVAVDADLDRIPVVPGASVYPFCWNVLLAARDRGLGGVMTTLVSRSEPDAGPLLALPEHHALAAAIFLGHPQLQPKRLSRRPVSSFATLDTFDGSTFGATD